LGAKGKRGFVSIFWAIKFIDVDTEEGATGGMRQRGQGGLSVLHAMGVSEIGAKERKCKVTED